MNFHKETTRNPVLMLVLICCCFLSVFRKKLSVLHYINPILAIVLLAVQFPRIANHSTLLLLVCIGFILDALLKLFSLRKFEYQGISYLIRITVVAVYWFAGFHKLNTDFFNTCTSCVIEINEYTLSNLILSKFVLSSNWIHFLQIGTIIMEMVIPVGLLFSQTRKGTMLLLLAFHAWLSLAVFADFCAVALVILVLSDFNFKKPISSRLVTSLQVYFIGVVLAVLIRLTGSYFSVDSYHIPYVQGLIFTSSFLILVFFYIKWFSPISFQFRRKYILPLSFVFIILSFWTLKTYLGLGNAGNLTMFSNLVTEKSRNNHLLLDTRKTKIADFEEDYVHIIYLNNPYIKEDFNNYLLPAVEFRYLVSQWKKWQRPIPCILYYKGKKINTNDITQTKFSESRWWYKYLCFRKIQVDQPNRCRW